MSRELVFKIGEESLPTHMNSDEAVNSPYSDIINLGIDHLKELLSTPLPAGKRSDRDFFAPNNIISFLGERGSGKSSSLINVRDFIQTTPDPLHPLKKLGERVEVMPLIDPSFFDENHNILDVFIGRLYNQYRKLCDAYNELDSERREKLKKLQTKFRAAKQAIYFINDRNQERPLDELDELSRLSSGNELSSIMYELITDYLGYLGKERLVISIDDLDLNVKQSYAMMEQIRKYLLHPNVVIILAAKLDQLRQGICCALTDHYHKVLDKYVSTGEIIDMAERYLEKFIPTSLRIYMPTPEDFMKTRLRIVDTEHPETAPVEYETVEFAVLSLIFEKTRFLFYNHDGETSLIVPRNMRELRYLVTMLYRMPYPDVEHRNIHTLNKAQFRMYFRQQWLQSITDAEQLRFVNFVFGETNFSKLNKLVVTYLTKFSKNLSIWKDVADDDADEKSLTKNTRKILREIVNPANNPANVSIGDVTFLMSLIRTFEDSEESKRLLFFIRTYYSMLLYELYDDMTDEKKLDENGICVVESTASSIPILPKTRTSNEIPEYFNFIGGSFFTLTGSSYIPVNNVSRELTEIDGEILFSEIKKIIAEYDPKKEPSQDFVNRLRLIEFFILTSRRILNNQKGSYSPFNLDTWRTKIDTIRFYSFAANTRHILFDATAPFVNLVYPKFAYDRYNNKLFDIARNTEGSILHSLLHKPEYRRDYKNNTHASLMSYMGIRNMEVLENLQLWLSKKRDSIRPEGNKDLGALQNFYKNIGGTGSASFSVKTYDRKPQSDDFHTIQFRPIFELADLLEKITLEPTLLSLFYKIYSPSQKIAAGASYSKVEIRRIMENLNLSIEIRNRLNSVFVKKNEIPAEEFVLELAFLPPLPADDVNSFFDQVLRELYKKTLLEISQEKLEKCRQDYLSNKSLLSGISKQVEKANKELEKNRMDKQLLNEQLLKIENEIKASNDILDIVSLNSQKESISTKLKILNDATPALVNKVTECDKNAEEQRARVSEFEAALIQARRERRRVLSRVPRYA